MHSSGKRPFSAYIDYAAQVEPALVLAGGPYNFTLEKNDVVSLNGIPAAKPHIGCMVTHQGAPYLFMLLRLSAPIDSFESCEVSIENPMRTIYWRMLGSYLYPLTRKADALVRLQDYPEPILAELYTMQEQYNKRFTSAHPLTFFAAENA